MMSVALSLHKFLRSTPQRCHVPEPRSLVWTVSWKMITAGPRVDNGTSRPQRVVVAFSSLVKCFRYASDASPRNLKRSSWRRSAWVR